MSKSTFQQMTPLQYFEFYKIVTQAKKIGCPSCHGAGWGYLRKGDDIRDIVPCELCGDDEALAAEKSSYFDTFEKERRLLIVYNSE